MNVPSLKNYKTRYCLVKMPFVLFAAGAAILVGRVRRVGDAGMTTSIRPLSIIIIAAAALFAVAASGDQIYRWAGADGATHFSETPPDVDLASVEILELVTGGRLPPTSRDYQSVLDVAKDIESSRLERERLRLEKKKLLLQSKQLRQSAMIPQEYDDDYGGVRLYYSPHYRYPRKPHRRHHYHRPVNPEPYSSQRYGRPGQGTHTGTRARVYIRQ